MPVTADVIRRAVLVAHANEAGFVELVGMAEVDRATAFRGVSRCMATYGNGARIIGTTITMACHWTARPGSAARVLRTASSAAGPGTTARATCVRPFATATTRRTATTPWAFAAPEFRVAAKGDRGSGEQGGASQASGARRRRRQPEAGECQVPIKSEARADNLCNRSASRRRLHKSQGCLFLDGR